MNAARREAIQQGGTWNSGPGRVGRQEMAAVVQTTEGDQAEMET